MIVTATVQEINGVLMLALAELVRRHLDRESGLEVRVEVCVDEPRPLQARLKYRLQDLLDQCDPEAPVSEQDQQWERMRPAGRELL